MDLIASSFAFLTALGFAGLLALDQSGYFTGPAPSLAQVVRLQGEARRQRPQDLTWDRALEGIWLTSDEYFATDADSAARLAFIEGAVLDIEASTMVRLERRQEELELTLLFGNADLWKPRKSSFRFKTQKIGVREQMAEEVAPPIPRYPSRPKTTTRVRAVTELRSPSILLQSQNEIDRYGNSPATPSLLASELKSRGSVKLRWGRVAAVSNYLVTWRPLSGGKTQTRTVTGEQTLTLSRLQPGQYEWSVRARNPAGVLSAAAQFHRFEFTAETPPQRGPRRTRQPSRLKKSQRPGPVEPLAVDVQ